MYLEDYEVYSPTGQSQEESARDAARRPQIERARTAMERPSPKSQRGRKPQGGLPNRGLLKLGLTLGILMSAGLLLANVRALRDTLQQITAIENSSRAIDREIATLRATNERLKATIQRQSEEIDTLKAVLESAFKALDTLTVARRLDRASLSLENEEASDPALVERESLAGRQSRLSSADFMALEQASLRQYRSRAGIPPAIAGLKGRRVGGRDPQAIRSVIQRHDPAITDLYQRELRNNPDLRGSLTLRFRIDENGYLTNPEIVGTTLRAPGLEQKILEKMRRWRDFGKSLDYTGETGYQLTYVFGDSLSAQSFAIYAVH